MNFLFRAHCHLMPAESSITCWASGTSGEGWGGKRLNLTESTMPASPPGCLLHLLADGFYLHIALQGILFPNECLFDTAAHKAVRRGGRRRVPGCAEKQKALPRTVALCSVTQGEIWALSPTYSLARGRNGESCFMGSRASQAMERSLPPSLTFPPYRSCRLEGLPVP